MTAKKEGFSSKIGFVLAAAGSAVGLGNIWRFPYLAAKYGGGIFLLTYLILSITFGFSMMITEIAIGRKTGKSVIGAYKEINKKFSFLGVVAALVPVIIVPYYCVIGGWVLKYFTMFLSSGWKNTCDDGAFFSAFIGNMGDATIYFVIFSVLTAVVIFAGVKNGIEKASKVLMPVLLVLIVAIAIYTLTLPGALDGLKYYLLPNFDNFTVSQFLKTVVAAMGQLFYSMSLAMGIMVTYGSYMRKEDSLESSVHQIEIFDTIVAVLAGLIIVPAVFVFSGGANLNAGPSLMFITLPNVFESFGAAGRILGAAFFFLVILAALTSSISLMETVSSIISERFKLNRTVSTIITLAIILCLGMLSVLGYSVWDGIKILGYQILDFFDFITNNIMMPIVELATCILIGYIVKTKYVEAEVMLGQGKFAWVKLYRVMVMVICPIFMVIILLTPFITTL